MTDQRAATVRERARRMHASDRFLTGAARQKPFVKQNLEQAREKGWRLAGIHSLAGISTERNAMRLGFSLANTKVVMAGDGLAVSV